MNTTRIGNLLLASASLWVWLYLRTWYTALTERTHLPEEFEHMIYRVVVVFLIVETIKGIIFLFYKPVDPTRRKDNFTIGINHISTVLYGLLFLALILSIVNISVKEAITSLSLIAAAVVLMTKDYISNLINGMYLTFAKVITIGDQVEIEGNKGKIVDITLTNVHLINEDDDMIFIPNNLVFTKEIINYTRRELKKTSIDFEVDPLMIHDIAALEARLIEALHPFAADIQPGTYQLKTVAIRKDHLQLKFQYILVDPLNKETDKKIRRHFVRELVRILAEGQQPD